MSEVGAADRSRLLRSKKAELSGIVTSRKRKLREFFAVCDNEGPIPQINLSNIDAPPTTQAEKHFLEVSDILQDRLFDESNLPTRRQLRSNTAKQRSPIRKGSPETRTSDASRKAAKSQRDRSSTRRSRAATPSSRSDGGPSTAGVEVGTDVSTGQGTPMQRSTSKGSQTDLPAEASATLDEIIEEPFENATHQQPSIPDNVVSAKELESDRIRTGVESPPNSPGADPRKVLPVSAEDAAELPEPLVEGLGSHDILHKAATVHLPPKEVQECHLRENKKARDQRDGQASQLSINLPPRDGARTAEPLSSPGSTVGANSATTPALHEASTDTSPDNESNRYDPERLENKGDDAQTPPEMRPTPEEIAEKEGHDRIQSAQIEVSRREILGSSPAGADIQLRMEEEAASSIDTTGTDRQAGDLKTKDDADATEGQERSDPLTKAADEVMQDVVEDQDEVDAVPTPEDERMTGIEPSKTESTDADSNQREVADSEAEDQTPPVDAMDVDATTVKDSFESSAVLESRAGNSPVEAEGSDSPEKLATDSKKSSVTPASSTPRRTPSTPVVAPPTLERMTTRVSSGAMRHKSVSEILGEIPRPNTTSGSERSPAKGATDSDSAGNSSSPSRSATPQSPSSRVRSLVEKAKEKERSKLSTVIFPGPGRAPAKSTSRDTALMPSGSQPSQAAKEDYFMPLFIATASADKRGVPSLDNLIATAHKTITTSNAYVPIIENQTVKILKRIYNLQSSGKWSLRQPKRSAEPIRPTTHWDVLLQEAKWMRTDFREERKWKMAVARNLASACMEWVSASAEDRKLLQVKATPPPKSGSTAEVSKDIDMGEGSSQPISHPTPELVVSGEFDSPVEDFDEEPRLNLLETVSPTAIFTLQDDDVVFGLRRSPTSDKLLNELPMYGAPLAVPQSELPTSELDPDRLWRRPALPLSKYVEGRMELKLERPPRKRSRFEYEDEDDDEDHVVFGEPGTKRPILPPEQTDVALFNPEHKHIRDRIQSSHQFRPPSEFPMPLQSFFECRTASQWTWDEDNDLKNHVRDYSYNWSLISSMLTSKSLFASGAERRTPWECFERWIHMEGLPADMQKTHYFRAYTSRIDQANRNVMAQAAQMPQQPNVNGQIQPPPRRRTTTSVRVERRRNQKHLTLVDAMRKLAKKRETSIQKQQHAAGLAAMRKANEVAQARGPLHTPQDFSRLKHEREEQMKERLIQLQQRQEAQRRAVLLQQRNAAQNPQQAGLPNGGPQQRLPPASGSLVPNGTPNSSGQNLTVPGQNRPRPMPPQMPGSSMQNGLRVPQMPMNGVPSVPMHGIQGQLPLPNPALDVGLVARAQNISEQQRQAIRMQQQGQLPGQSPQMHNSPPRMNGMPQPGFQLPNNMMPPYNPNTNGVGTPPSNNMISSPGQGQAGSPRMGQAHSGGGGGVSHVKILEQQLQAKYPNATPEQVTRMIQEHLSKSVHQQQQRQGLAQSAMNAAAGGAGGNGMAGMNPGQGTPQLYAQMLRQQQENQQKAAQAQQAANAVGNGQGQQGQNQGSGQVPSNGQVNGTGNGHQGHAHRGSSGSVQSGK